MTPMLCSISKPAIISEAGNAPLVGDASADYLAGGREVPLIKAEGIPSANDEICLLAA